MVLKQKVKQVILGIFDPLLEEFNLGFAPETLINWNSLHHINLIL